MNTSACNAIRERVLDLIPHRAPFRFVDELLSLDTENVLGTYTFRRDEYFYQGHFPGFPITPGMILTETMAQIGVLALGIYLLNLSERSIEKECPVKILFTDSKVRFHRVVLPGEQVFVEGEKQLFRLNTLKCRVTMRNARKEVVAKGMLTGRLL